MNIKKLVNSVVNEMQKDKSKKGYDNLWDYFTERLNDEGAWKQEDLSLIEDKINNKLSELNDEEVKNLWLDSATGLEKIALTDEITVEDMKADITNETLDRVMDKLGGIEGDYFRDYSNNPYFNDDDSDDEDMADFDEEPLPDEIGDDFDLDDDFNLDEDDEY